MKDYFNKLENFRYNTTLSIITIAFVFTLDLLTPLGFAVWILYLLPLLMNPYKNLSKPRIFSTALSITALLWFCYFNDAPGITPIIDFINRLLMTFAIWVTTYIQIQRANTHRRILLTERKKSEEALRQSEERFRVAQEVSP
ncbi:MAG: hypothetical protein ACM3Q2_00095, partial [Syntrophothermus sp.]